MLDLPTRPGEDILRFIESRISVGQPSVEFAQIQANFQVSEEELRTQLSRLVDDGYVDEVGQLRSGSHNEYRLTVRGREFLRTRTP